MRRRIKVGIAAAAAVALFVFFVPLIPSGFPASLFCSYLCNSVNCNFCGTEGHGLPNVYTD
jgi:hypothetical protein